MMPFRTGLLSADDTPADGYYWRVNILSAEPALYARVAELEFRATPGGADQVPLCTTFNMGAAGEVWSDFQAITGAETWKAFDNNGSTIADTGVSQLPDYIGFHFPNKTFCEQVSLSTGVGTNAGRITGLTIDYSNDGVTWTNRATFSGIALNFNSTYLFNCPANVPSFTSGPTISTDSGFYGEGDVATVSYTTPATSADFGATAATFQWTRDGVDVSGATSATYTYVSADVGHTVTCRVTLTNPRGSSQGIATGHAIVTPTFATDSRVTDAGEDRVTDTGDVRVITYRTA